jgi:hypothetical protein
LVEDVFEALVIGEDIAMISHQIVPPYLEGMGRIIELMGSKGS